jgi:hypothetical protein
VCHDTLWIPPSQLAFLTLKIFKYIEKEGFAKSFQAVTPAKGRGHQQNTPSTIYQKTQ